MADGQSGLAAADDCDIEVLHAAGVGMLNPSSRTPL
jgi:hypothetical protein